MTRKPRGLWAEAALALLGSAAHAYSIATTTPPQPLRGRAIGMGTPLGSLKPHDALAQGALLRYVSVCEAYIDAVLDDRVRSLVPPSTATAITLLESYASQATRSWQARDEAYKAILGVAFRTSGHWQALDGATQVRNSIAHGLGALTTQQRGRSSVAQNVSRVGARVSGGRVLLAPDTPHRTWNACRGFVRDVDLMVNP